MDNVANPIIIDQFYCDSPKSCDNQVRDLCSVTIISDKMIYNDRFLGFREICNFSKESVPSILSIIRSIYRLVQLLTIFYTTLNNLLNYYTSLTLHTRVFFSSAKCLNYYVCSILAPKLFFLYQNSQAIHFVAFQYSLRNLKHICIDIQLMTIF